MPESGYYEKRPRREHQEFLVQGLLGRASVSDVERIDDFRFVVTRNGKSTIRVYLTNQYILGITDAMEILGAAPDTTCIASTMTYNQYSPEAKAYCRERGVGLFHSAELFSAVRFDGDRFVDYVRPKGR